MQEFSGEGQSKRASEQVASQKALAFLQSKNLIPQEPLTTPDWPTPTTPLPPPPAAQQVPPAPPLTPGEKWDVSFVY
jgi:hypothetical protein